MPSLKIGIIENDLLIAESIAITLLQIGYRSTQPVRNYADALNMIKIEAPDLLLVDIVLDGKLDGIDLAGTVNRDYNIPFIFLTANSDSGTVNRAKEVKPYAYLVKPFNENDLYSSIEIAFSNYNKQNNTKVKTTGSGVQLKNFIFIKEGEVFRKIEINDILYLESDNVYLNIYTPAKHFVTRNKLDNFIAEFSKGNFFRTHRSYAINLNHLETINALSVKVGGKEIPLNKNYKQELLNAVKLLK